MSGATGMVTFKKNVVDGASGEILLEAGQAVAPEERERLVEQLMRVVDGTPLEDRLSWYHQQAEEALTVLVRLGRPPENVWFHVRISYWGHPQEAKDCLREVLAEAMANYVAEGGLDEATDGRVQAEDYSVRALP